MSGNFPPRHHQDQDPYRAVFSIGEVHGERVDGDKIVNYYGYDVPSRESRPPRVEGHSIGGDLVLGNRYVNGRLEQDREVRQVIEEPLEANPELRKEDNEMIPTTLSEPAPSKYEEREVSDHPSDVPSMQPLVRRRGSAAWLDQLRSNDLSGPILPAVLAARSLTSQITRHRNTQ